MTSAKRERAEVFLSSLPRLSKAIGDGKSAELPLRGGTGSRFVFVNRHPAAAAVGAEKGISPNLISISPTTLCLSHPRFPQKPSQHHQNPSTEHYYCANFSEFSTRVSLARGRLGVCLEHLGVAGAKNATADPDQTQTHCDENGVLHFGLVALLNDHLDKVDRCLDDIAAGRGHTFGGGGGSVPVGASVSNNGAWKAPSKRSGAPREDETTRRPQDFFTPPVDNADVAWHAPAPFGVEGIREAPTGTSPVQPFLDALEYSRESLSVVDELAFDGEREKGPIFVDTEGELANCALDCAKVTAFAVDLEHHSNRSFKGFTCLVQISTDTNDYVIDVLNPEVRATFAKHFAKLFLDPKITKVFHGAEYDVKWLQRDFGIYVVNLFDTYQACRVLETPKKSLAYLLSLFCGVAADKQYQLADWRVRPLSKEMLSYASTDTKYLLYIYERLKKRLFDVQSGALAKGAKKDAAKERSGDHDVSLIRQVFDASAKTCALLYSSPSYSKSSWRDAYFKLPSTDRTLTQTQLSVFSSLHKWRDATARMRDESTNYVISKSLLLRIARAVPTTTRSLLAVTRGDAPLVHEHADQVVDLIARAAARGKPPGLDFGDGDGAGADGKEGAAGGVVGGASDTVRDATPDSEQSPGKKKLPEPPPGSVLASGGGSAAAAMMGFGFDGNKSQNKSTVGNADGAGSGSAMARMMSGDITTNGTASGSASIRTTRDKLDADALLAAQKINELLFQTPVPLSALFPRASGFGFESRPEPGGRHKRELVLSGTAMDAEKNSPDGHKKDNADDVATGPSPKSETVALPGGGSAPAPLRKDVNEKKRKAQALEAELAAATKARAASARDELARRRGAFARTGEESDSDSDDEGADGDKKNSGIDPEGTCWAFPKSRTTVFPYKTDNFFYLS
jgi:exosome complex exonuclease RRP6